ncbi:PorP/SprF family type IX secretion system membrane protein [Rasiella sp. SM2506]|uniref:PorP/SprF family type IX secretion system membrane protein n=1 Tax=Rasiella sp. SM2506 TaxID=3423914 RepID=UPI003D7B811B
MRKIIKYILVLLAFQSYSQELNLPVFSQYLADNDFVVSPTFAGIGDNFRVRANGLMQWVGIKDAPQNQALYADIRIANRTGVGFSMYNDKNGNTRQQGFKISYAHHLILDYKTKQYLSLGISYNMNSFKIDIENFETTYDIPFIDPSIRDNRKTTNINFDVGALYRFRTFFMSFNANNLLQKDTENFTGFEPQSLLNLQLYTGYVIKSENYSQFEPSVFYQLFASDQRSSTDINLKYRKFNRDNDYFWVGGSYRFLNDQIMKPLSIGPMIGIKKSIIYFSYAYQITLNELTNYNSGTHSVTIGFDLLQALSDCPCTVGNNER